MVRIIHTPALGSAAPPQTPAAIRRQAVAAAKRVEPYRCPFRIIRDTREQAGWTFQGLQGWSKQNYRPLEIEVVDRGLATADYAVEFEHRSGLVMQVPVLIERKSGDDLIGSLGAGHQRFEAEHVRMTAMVEKGWQCWVIVEESLDSICERLDDPLFGRRLTSAGVIGAAMMWPVRFGVHWQFAGTRRLAEVCALRLMWSLYEEYERTWKKKEIERLTAAGK